MEDGIPRWLQHHYEMCCEKGGHHRRQACMIQRWFHHGDVLWQLLITKTNDHTNGKSLSWISSGEFTRELDKESLLN